MKQNMTANRMQTALRIGSMDCKSCSLICLLTSTSKEAKQESQQNTDRVWLVLLARFA